MSLEWVLQRWGLTHCGQGGTLPRGRWTWGHFRVWAGAGSLQAFPRAACLFPSLRIYFSLGLSFSPFICDLARLSRIFGMCFLAAAESQLSHFTDGTVVRACILSEDLKRAGEHCKNTTVFEESCECLVLRGRPPGYLFSGRKWWKGSFVLWGESGVIQPKQSLVKSPSFLLSFQKILYDEEFWSSWGLSWWCDSWAPWLWKIFNPGGLCKLGCVPFRLESQRVSQPAITCPVSHCCPFCCWITVQQWSVGCSAPELRDGAFPLGGPFPLGSPWALRILTFCCAEGSLLEMPTPGRVFF